MPIQKTKELQRQLQKCPINHVPTRDGRYCIEKPTKMYDSLNFCSSADIEGK